MSQCAETTVSRFRPGEDDLEVLALRAEVWGAEHPLTNPAYFAWLFGKENPAGQGSGVMLRRAGQLVGFAGLCQRLARLNGCSVLVAHGLDYMVSPGVSGVAAGRFAHRVPVEWGLVARDLGCDFGMNFPNENSRRLLTSKRLGWRLSVAPKLMARPLSGGLAPGAGLRGAGARIGLGVAGGAFGGVARVRRGRIGGAVVALDPARPTDAEMIDCLWARVADTRSCGFVRDAAALSWRYGKHPLHRYEINGWHSDENGLSALVVTTRRRLHGLDCLLIVDVLVDPGAQSAASRLMDEVSRASRAQMALAQAVQGDDAFGAFSRAGFAVVPEWMNEKPFMLVTMPLRLEGAASLETATWRFAWGDMDVV